MKKIRRCIKIICKFANSSTDEENITSFNKQIKELEMKVIKIMNKAIKDDNK